MLKLILEVYRIQPLLQLNHLCQKGKPMHFTLKMFQLSNATLKQKKHTFTILFEYHIYKGKRYTENMLLQKLMYKTRSYLTYNLNKVSCRYQTSVLMISCNCSFQFTVKKGQKKICPSDNDLCNFSFLPYPVGKVDAFGKIFSHEGRESS